MNPDDLTRRQLLLMAMLTEGGMAAVACLLGWLLGVPLWENIHFSGQALWQGVLITAPMVAAFFLFVLVPVGPLGRIKQFVEQVVKPLFRKCSLLELAFIAFLAGLGEEFLFRGVFQPFLMYHLGLWPGLLLAALLFGLAHPITPGYVVLAALVGIYLGWFTYQFGNLFEATFAHAVYDFIGLVYLVYIEKDQAAPLAMQPEPTDPPPATESEGEPPAFSGGQEPLP